MKVGIVTTWKARCGICTYSAFLGEELVRQGIDVLILAEKASVLPKGVDPNFTSQLPYKECWDRNKPFTELLEFVGKEKFDVIHIQHQFGLFPFFDTLKSLLQGLKSAGVKVVVTLHDVIPFDPQMEEYFNTILYYADKIIVHTPTCYRLLVVEWNCVPEKIVLILHGTKLITVPPKEESRNQLGLPLDAKIILSWGFIWESKGIMELVEVLQQLLKDDPKIMFIHAGGLHPVFARGEYLKKILTNAFKMGIRPEQFKITGFINESQIRQYFGACDLIVLNYMRGSASASGAAHRALSAGKPIVGSDDPCIEEIPKLTVPRGDKTALYQGIKTVLQDPEKQKELVKKIDTAVKETSWEVTAVKHLEVYKN
jgi:glycosyltransferase involved in cell wall biosynthesis